MENDRTLKIYSHNISEFAKENLFYVELAGEYNNKSDYNVY